MPHKTNKDENIPFSQIEFSANAESVRRALYSTLIMQMVNHFGKQRREEAEENSHFWVAK